MHGGRRPRLRRTRRHRVRGTGTPTVGLRGGGGALAGWLVLATSLQASPWAQVRTVAPGPPSAIGEAANGCLAGAQALPAEGKGYVQIRRERQRQFGHPQTLDFVRELGAARVIFGSDAGGRSYASQLAKVMSADLSDADRRLILGGNIERLLRPILADKGIKL